MTPEKNMKTITVAYFHGNNPSSYSVEKLPVKPGEEPFSLRRRNVIIDKVLRVGLNVLLQQYKKEDGVHLVIWIDKYRFQQR